MLQEEHGSVHRRDVEKQGDYHLGMFIICQLWDVFMIPICSRLDNGHPNISGPNPWNL